MSCAEGHSVQPEVVNMAELLNSELLAYLKKLDTRMDNIEKKLNTLEEVEKKVSSFESELKKLWLVVEDRNRKLGEQVTRVEEKTESIDFALSAVDSKVSELEKQRNTLQEEVVYLQSQSMRNKLMFGGIPEPSAGTTEDTENTLRTFLHEKMKLAKEEAASIRLERVHRSPGSPVHGKTRNIVAKFSYFKDREMVRKKWKELDGTGFTVFEQYPPEVIRKRRLLVPKMKEARRLGKKAYLAFDTLYIDGTPVRA